MKLPKWLRPAVCNGTVTKDNRCQKRQERDGYSEYVVTYADRQFRMAVADPDDIVQGHHVRGTFYETEELEYIQTVVPPGSTVADVGANVGNHAVFFARVCNATLVIPFEVNEDAIVLLRKNVSLNAPKRIDLSYLGLAVGKSDGFVTKILPNKPHNLGATSFAPSDTETAYPVRSLDSILPGKEIDFMKIDVEGMELEVIEGAANIISKSRPILFVEVRKRDVAKYHALMRTIGYRTERTFQRYRNVFNFLSIFGR